MDGARDFNGLISEIIVVRELWCFVRIQSCFCDMVTVLIKYILYVI